MAKGQPSLPAKRAFVVQLHAEAQTEHGHFRGRVEHLVSHQAEHFESLEELIAFMVRMLTEQQKPHESCPAVGGLHTNKKKTIEKGRA
jgi:hypothetical protein